MKYSKQKWFCSNCGEEQHSPTEKAYGQDWKCCNAECFRKMKWKEVLSMMGQDYYDMPSEKGDE